MRSSILARILGFRQWIIPEPRVPSRGSQAQGTRLGLDFPFKLPVIYVGNQVIRSNTEPYLHYHCSTPIYATRTCYLFLQHKGRTIRFLREGGGLRNFSVHEFFFIPQLLARIFFLQRSFNCTIFFLR